ncbi:helix-turn-helix domain-containing protein [Simiduia litorea]|uniref:winged helix-turn-helix transcriptional regulator n=1 Tax=Simiduia litorea TaxID=1435348 RepID=UPI0036F399EE
MTQQQLMVNATIAHGLDVIGDRWALLILRDAFLGCTRFEAFRQQSGISKATLTRRLDALIAEGVLQKKAYAANRYDYVLSQKGKRLFASSLLAWQWENQWCKQEPTYPLPPKLEHVNCQHTLEPEAVCSHCNLPIKLNQIQLPLQALNASQQIDAMQSLTKQRRVRSTEKPVAVNESLATISDLIGDRWTLLTLICAFFGVKRYDDFLLHLHIATNILTQRLNHLVEVKVLERKPYQENPVRMEYLLTEKGRSLFTIVMSLRQWVCMEYQVTSELIEPAHKPCGRPLRIEIQCKHCKTAATTKDVTFL